MKRRGVFDRARGRLSSLVAIVAYRRQRDQRCDELASIDCSYPFCIFHITNCAGIARELIGRTTSYASPSQVKTRRDRHVAKMLQAQPVRIKDRYPICWRLARGRLAPAPARLGR